MGLKRNQNKTPIVKDKNDAEVPTKMQVALQRVWSYLKEYCSCCGVHGFRYLSEGSRNIFERLFWVTAIAISIFGCSMMVAKIKTKMDTTPVIVTLAENPTKNWHVPFPAVTLCPGSKVGLRAFNFTKYQKMGVKNRNFTKDFFKWINESKTSKDKHDYTSQSSDYNAEFPWLSNSTLRNSLYKKLWALRTMPERYNLNGLFFGNGTLALDEDDMEFLVEVAPKMNNGKNFYKELGNNMVRWKAQVRTLDHHFKHLWTDYGLCYTFNMMDNIHVYRDGMFEVRPSKRVLVLPVCLWTSAIAGILFGFSIILSIDSVNNEVFQRKGLDKNFPKPSNDWDPDKGYTNVLSVKTYPWRAPHETNRGRNVLTIMMTDDEVDMEEYAGKGSSSYAILFHNPQDHPMLTLNNAITMPFYKFLDINIRINVVTTSPGLKNYDPHQRQCYYSHEKQLEYFKFYSQSNCQLECLTNVSLRMCGCVQFYMPRYKTTKICGADAFECYLKALSQYDETEIFSTLKYLSESGKLPFNDANTHDECDCLPNCLSVSYGADVLTNRDLDISIFQFSMTSPPKPGERLAPAGVWIKIPERFFTATQRSEYYGPIDFLANCGGFFGLFCGFSILSFIEIIYFLTIRLWTNVYRRSTSRVTSEIPGARRIFAESSMRIVAFDN